jgi:hypothetical protein
MEASTLLKSMNYTFVLRKPLGDRLYLFPLNLILYPSAYDLFTFSFSSLSLFIYIYIYIYIYV